MGQGPFPTDGLTAEKIADSCRRGGWEQEESKVKSGAIETTVPETAEPELGEPRCPNGHDSATPPRSPSLIFVTCPHYSGEATWHEYCVSCGIRHEPFMIYRDFYRMGDQVQPPKNYCGYCGAKMVSGAASR